MKYFFNLIFVTLSSVSLTLGQKSLNNLTIDSAKLFVEYAVYTGYSKDSSFLSLNKSFLFLGLNEALFIYQRQTPNEYLNALGKKIDESGNQQRKKDLIESFKKQFDVDKLVSDVYLRYYNSPAFFEHKELNKQDIWISDTAVYKWSLANEFRSIQGYKCQKAERINSRGAPVTAWFTEEIPIPAGPFYLSRLPGLILEVSNPDQKGFIRAISISSTEIPEQKFRKWLTGQIVSKAEFSQMYIGESKKIEQIKRMMESKENKNQ